MAFPSRVKVCFEQALANIYASLIFICGKLAHEFDHRRCVAPMIPDEDRGGQLGLVFADYRNHETTVTTYAPRRIYSRT
ncbi:MAG: hypothetical protein ABI192_08980 [Bradyrhizobium sp.]